MRDHGIKSSALCRISFIGVPTRRSYGNGIHVHDAESHRRPNSCAMETTILAGTALAMNDPCGLWPSKSTLMSARKNKAVGIFW